jgi:hypothetical protein
LIVESNDDRVEPCSTAQLAGGSLLVLAVAVLALPWAVTGRKPARPFAAALLATAVIVTDVGVATLRSGLDGAVVTPLGRDATISLWILGLPCLFAYVAAVSRGWANRAAAVLLILASPIVAFVSYAIGPWDARPWWEAVSGFLMIGAGACVLVGAIRPPARRREDALEPAVAP